MRRCPGRVTGLHTSDPGTELDHVETRSANGAAVCTFYPWLQALVVQVVATRQEVGDQGLVEGVEWIVSMTLVIDKLGAIWG